MKKIDESAESEWVTQPIAIIELICKFAGDTTSLDRLWDMLADGRSAWSEIPLSRFNLRGAYGPNSETSVQ
ncbi:hypothetical protein N7456_004379 [Penicillium angulare]|uniref:Beta-ketoacyl synthase-like N-terminal domain-containing protein n=1 Tax=Penicillium angulare TaxID=116970 RepID=A0A9W9FWH7_9EURO|nr:hypothetical protein N7456_004379 [Penicillium angulare]